MKIEKLLLAVSSIAIMIFLSEIFLLATDLDLKSIKPILYTVEGEIEYDGPQPFRASRDNERLYELVPDTQTVGLHLAHEKEQRYRSINISINSIGMRGKEPTLNNSPNVTRILVMGGSNTYGFSVNNEETYPAQMQKILDQRYPGKFEVWNSGISAYVMSQQIAYLEELKAYGPDIVIIEDCNGMGRRAFYYNDTEYVRLLNSNPTLLNENIPLLLPAPEGLKSVHHSLIRQSRLYRLLIIDLDRLIVASKIGRCVDRRGLWSCYDLDLMQDFGEFSGIWTRGQLEKFLAKNNEIDIIFFEPLARYACNLTEIDGKMKFTLCPDGLPDEYSDLHPPSYVYSWYAETLVGMLEKEYPSFFK
jgi:hypothetical protein